MVRMRGSIPLIPASAGIHSLAQEPGPCVRGDERIALSSPREEARMRTVLALIAGAVLMTATASAQERTRTLVTFDNVTIDLIAEGKGPLIVLLPSRGRDSEDGETATQGQGEGRHEADRLVGAKAFDNKGSRS